MEQSKKVLCSGLIFVDVLMNGLEELPSHWEQTLLAEGAHLGIGGGAANSAKTFGILGQECDLHGKVGRDGFGRLVKDEMKRTGVGAELLIEDKEISTGVAAGLVHRQGKRCFVTARGANQEFCKADFAGVNPDKYDFLHINGYFQFPKLEKDLREIMEYFHAAGVTISFDTASWDPSGRWYETVKPFVDCIDYMFLNDAQLMKLTGQTTVEDSAAFLLLAGVKNVVAKLGEEGCALFRSGKPVLKTATVTYPVCDTSGAGDSFDAAYITGLKLGWDESKCGRFANTVAGLNCCKVGSTAGVPDFETACKKMKELYKDE